MLNTLKQPLFYAAGLLLMKGISFIMMPVVARNLSTTEYGVLDLWLSLLNVGSIIIGFGLIDALYKQLADVEDDLFNPLMSTAALAQSKIAGIALLCLLPFIVPIAFYISKEAAFQFALLAITLVAGALINIPLSWLRLIDHAKQFFFLTSSKALIQAMLTWYFLHLGLGVTGVLLSASISAILLAGVLSYLQFKQTSLVWLPFEAKQLFRYGMPLIFSGIFLFIASGAERWILAGQVGLEQLAQYAIAMQFAMMVSFLCEPFTLWWFPKRFKILKAKHGLENSARLAELICHMSLLFSAILTITAPLAIQWLLPERYYTTMSILPWLALGMAFKQMSHVLNIGCYVNALPTLVLKINVVISVLALVMFSVSGYFFGLHGIVKAFVLLYAIRAFVFTFFSQRHVRLPHQYIQLSAHITLCLAITALSSIPSVSIPLFLLQAFILLVWIIRHFFRSTNLLNPIVEASQ